MSNSSLRYVKILFVLLLDLPVSFIVFSSFACVFCSLPSFITMGSGALEVF